MRRVLRSLSQRLAHRRPVTVHVHIHGQASARDLIAEVRKAANRRPGGWPGAMA